MDASVDKADPRVAPAVKELSAVTQRVHAVWKRMGIASQDRQQKWKTFLYGALLPFLNDFCALQEAAECNAAMENDALLREVCHLAARLDEAPRNPEVASIVSVLKEYYAQTQQRYPLSSGGDDRESSGGYERCPSDIAAKPTATSRTESSGGGCAKSSVPPSSGKEVIYLALPSFTRLLGDRLLPRKQSENNDERQREFNLRGSSAILGTHENSSYQSSNESSSDEGSATIETLRRLLSNNTHEGVRQQLQAELDRLQRLADHRLRVLQLLCKQRAITNRSAQEQVLLRAAYRAKYLDNEETVEEQEDNAHGEYEQDRKRAARAPNPLVEQRPPTTAPPDVVSARSSRFHSPLTSPKASGLSTVPLPGVKCEDDRENASEEVDTTAVSGNRQTSSLQEATRAELQLLMSAASCSLELPRVANNGAEEDLALYLRPTCNPTAVKTESNATDEKAAPLTGAVADARRISAPTHTAVRSPSTTPTSEAARPTVMEMDVSSITAYGTHQDLTLTRIQTEAEAIIRCIDEQNRRMQLETQEELHALDALNMLWRAISVQKTSPKTSLRSVSLHCSKDVVCHEGKGSDSAHGNRENESATARPAATSICPPFLLPLKPDPYERTVEEIVGQYRHLDAAYKADVAAQQRQEQEQPWCHAACTTRTQILPASHCSVSSVVSSSNGSMGTTLPAAKVSSERAGEEKCAPQAEGGFYLPPVVRQVLRAASYAPVLDFVHRSRVAFQAHLSTQQDLLVEKAMARLRDVYAAYYAATRDEAYAVVPDGELRVAMEEELLETLPREQIMAVDTPPPSPAGEVLACFQRHLTACQQVREQAADEFELLTLRLHIIGQAAPLVHNYQAILREETEMRWTSRERLLNKKVNMAKQLLQEEKTRRRVAKELPRIVSQLKELVAAWDALQAATDPSDDTVDVGNPKNQVLGVAGSSPQVSAKAELCIHGQRVCDLLTTTSRAPTPPPVSRVRNRSASSPPPPLGGAHLSTRSVSPTLPASTRPRTEQRFAVPGQRPSPHTSRKASPTPATTYSASQPLPGGHRVTGVGTASAERPGSSQRPNCKSALSGARSYTPPYSQPTSSSCKPSPTRLFSARVPSRSPPPLLPHSPRHGLSAVSSNASSQLQKKTLHSSTSPSPSSISATTVVVRKPRFM